MKSLVFVYTDRFSKRNVETSCLLGLFREQGIDVKTINGINALNLSNKLLITAKIKLYEILKYRFMEIKKIQKQMFRHRFKHRSDLMTYDKLKVCLGFPFSRSKIIFSILNYIFISLPCCVKDLQADLILISNMQDYVAQSYIKYAQRRKIKIIPLISSWDHLTHGSQVIEASCIPFYMVWNEIQKNELISIHGIEPSKIRIVGALQFDYLLDVANNEEFNKDEIYKKYGIDRSKKIIFLPAYNERHGRYEPYIVKTILEKKHLIKCSFQIVLRPYPKDEHFRSRFFDVLSNTNVTVADICDEVISDRTSLCLLLKCSDIVLSGCGTAAIEAMYYDTNVIHLLLDKNETHEIDTLEKSYFFSDHYKYITEAGASFLVFTVQELVDGINIYFENPHFHGKERQNVVKQQLFLNTEKSAMRIFQAVMEEFD
jgi:hypothetical protein